MRIFKAALTGWIASGLLAIVPQSRSYAQEKTASVRADMNMVYQAFRDLQPYLYSKILFLSDSNNEKIGELLETLSSRFHDVERLDSKYAGEPGFASTLKVMSEMLDDSRSRFKEGKKEYALWRLKTSANYCVSCHTRHEIPVEFSGGAVNLETLNTFEQGEFYLATRQLDKAKEKFLAVVNEPVLGSLRMEALRKWLVLNTRVHPDPQAALQVLNKVRSKVKLSAYEDDEVVNWIHSLRRWQNESKAEVPPLVKAENLVRQGLGMDDPLMSTRGTVELLRASAILHKLLEDRTNFSKSERAHVLYLLGLVYKELPFFFVDELPEIFLEQSIRENPGSEDAKKAFRLYQEIMTFSYTGSGGTRLPDEILLIMKELHDLAYGIPNMKGQV